jgi:hypothetical protein
MAKTEFTKAVDAIDATCKRNLDRYKQVLEQRNSLFFASRRLLEVLSIPQLAHKRGEATQELRNSINDVEDNL